MANLTVRRDVPASSPSSEPGTQAPFDPFQTMRELFRWEPFAELARGWPGGDRFSAGFVPQFDVKETGESFVFRADVPGVQEKDLEVAVANNRLVISGQREAEHEDKGDSYYKRERTWGAFTRSFTLPNNVDPSHSTAELKNGVLVIALPKLDMSQPKKIAIKASERSSDNGGRQPEKAEKHTEKQTDKQQTDKQNHP
jgi:HSP20 family protein